jgi:hypothetical protein
MATIPTIPRKSANNAISLPVAYKVANDMYADNDDQDSLDGQITSLASMAKGDQDNMYYHQAMKQPYSW